MALICPSILSADFARLGEAVSAVTHAGADMIHIDIMDGHFVPNLTVGPMVVKSLRPYSALPFDVHLMITPVDPMVEAFCAAGADRLSVHPESGPHLDRTLRLIKSFGAKAGVVLNPSTPIESIEWVLDEVDLVLVMSVNPGFGGQSFLTSQLNKIEQLRALLDRRGSTANLQVDGGINDVTAKACIDAGATALVAGHYIFSAPVTDYAKRILALKGGAA